MSNPFEPAEEQPKVNIEYLPTYWIEAEQWLDEHFSYPSTAWVVHQINDVILASLYWLDGSNEFHISMAQEEFRQLVTLEDFDTAMHVLVARMMDEMQADLL